MAELSPRLYSGNKIGLTYVGCIAAIYCYIAVGPTFQRTLLTWFPGLPGWMLSVLEFLSGEAARTALFSGAYGVICLVYFWALLNWARVRLSLGHVWLWTMIFTALLLPMPPHFSDDIIGYAQHGRVLAEYHASPYLHTLTEFGDPWAQYRQYWSHQKSPYGPVMTVLLGGVSAISGDRVEVAVALLKILAAGCFLLSGWLLAKILKSVEPEEEHRGLFLFLWNPLVLLEFAGQGHNDAVMMVLMMAGFFLVVCARHVSGFTVLVLSVLTKFGTAGLLPLHAALQLRRRDFRGLLVAGAVALSIVVGFYTVFFRDPQSLSGVREVSQLAWLTPTWIGNELLGRYGWDPEAARRLVQIVCLAAFFVFLAWRAVRVTSERALLRESGFVLLFFFLVPNNQMNPWYLATVIPLAAMAPNALLRYSAMALTLWPLFNYYRPLMVQPPFWANCARMLLFYGAVLVSLWLGWRRTQAMGSEPQ